MPSESLTPERVLTLLKATPSHLAALTDGVAPAHLRTAPAPDAWSAVDVLAHLRACADIWGSCIAAIITQDRPTLRAINPRSWIKKTDYRDLDFQPSLHAFAAQRTDLLAVLEPLPPEEWSRSATVTGAGAILQRSVLFYAQWLARHERPHVQQIARLVTAVDG